MSDSDKEATKNALTKTEVVGAVPRAREEVSFLRYKTVTGRNTSLPFFERVKVTTLQDEAKIEKEDVRLASWLVHAMLILFVLMLITFSSVGWPKIILELFRAIGSRIFMALGLVT